MKRNDRIKLEAISRIDEDIIEKNANIRYGLAQAYKRRTRLTLIAVAATLALLIATMSIFVIPTLSKTVPTYTGMTVSDSPVASVKTDHTLTPLLLAAGGRISASANPVYTAQPGQDLFITVHFDNPDEYEIVSFVINGTKYTSYMFEYGSDLENIIIKVNAGDREGVISFTIDAIKYIDDVTIRNEKNVKMGADDTVKVLVQKRGVTPPDTTVTPDTTTKPEVTTAPDTTTKPEVTTAPDTTTKPEVSTAPDTTVKPEVTTAPDTATKPEVTPDPDTAYTELFVEGLYTDSQGAVYRLMADNSVTLVSGPKDSAEMIWPQWKDKITVIGEKAFYRAALTKLQLPEGVRTVEKKAFAYCDKLISATLPDSLTELGASAFEECDNLTSVTVPKNIKVLRERVFYGSTFLETCLLPDGLEVIEKEAFAQTHLEKITLPASLHTLGTSVFEATFLETVALPEGITHLPDGAFTTCQYLYRVDLPQSLITVGKDVFTGCLRLEEITLPTDLTAIGEGSFSNCDKLESITLPEGVTVLERYLFADCDTLTEVILKGEVTVIKESCFYGCISLSAIDLPKTLETVEWQAFKDTALSYAILPASLTSVESCAFDESTVLYLETAEQPEWSLFLWPDDLSFTVYTDGKWEIVDGKPKPKDGL